LLKDSVPCPIPYAEKDAPQRSLFEFDNSQGRAAFNRDHALAGRRTGVSEKPVAQMTRIAGGY
jgi:hypothetical protein